MCSSAWAGVASGVSQEVEMTILPNGADVTKSVLVQCPLLGAESVSATIDGTILLSATNDVEFLWQPQKRGLNKLVYTAGELSLTTTVNVVGFDYFVQPTPNPPMAKDSNISITPTTRDFEVGGGGGAIITSGSGSWTAAVSDLWITLNATSGSVGYPVAYTVSANTNVETRVGYVYVSGYTHTVTQAGIGADVDKTNITVEHQGGNGIVNVTAQNRIIWQARPNVDWISVSPTSGAGEGSVSYQVAPYNEVATRQGTMTVAGNTVTVFQYGRRMKLESYSETRDWYTHVIPITVNALAITEWSVKPNASWISIVDAGNGKGSDLVSIAISENPSYKARTGTVTIGTETFTVTQDGRTDLAFNVSPASSEASVEGAYGLVAVTATPDLPWTAKSGANWVTIVATTASGAGNGNIVYSASPNSTLYNRTGTITVTPDTASGMPSRTHTVIQPAAVASLSLSGYEFVAAGESCAVEVSVADIVEWQIEESLDWLTVNGSTFRTGPGVVTLQAEANNTIYPRSGTVTIARKTFTVTQKARGVEVEYDSKLFGTDGGMESISIHPDGNSSWTAVASDPTWITIFQGDSGTGDGEIMYIISPYVGDGSARTGWITVGDKKIYITQRAYDLSISPNGKTVTGNNGAGEIAVSASIGDVWNAIVTEPWITIVEDYDSGTGSGTVKFIYTENNTGKTRVGKIIIAGEVYTLEQLERTMVPITATAGRGGKVSGGGSYDLGSEVTLTAIPDDGYKFSYWTGDVSTMQNPIKLTADVAKSYTAVFEPLPIAFDSVTSGTDGVRLSWNNLAWATIYRIYRGVTSVPSSATQLAEIVNTGNCTYLDESGVAGTTYWYWIEAEGVEDSVMSEPMTGMKEKPIVISPISYTNLRGSTHSNPDSYQEGTLVSFSNPSGVTGYTFAGWTPSQITADMTGAQTVRANWRANSYTISYNANGGSGTMDGTSATYDSEATVAENIFTKSGYIFKGWATEEGGDVVYAPGQSVSNLTAQSGGVVTLYAVWEAEKAENPIITPGDGTIFKTATCTVTITCATPDAKIYYTTNGRTPSENDRFLYTGPFTISETTTVTAFAIKNGKMSDYVDATITYVEPIPLTLNNALDEPNLISVETGGEAEWIAIEDDSSQVGDSLAVSGDLVDDDEQEHNSFIKIKVKGKGRLSFWWRVDCEPDPRGRFTYDRATLNIDGDEIACRDGITDWMNHSVEFDTVGEHEVVLTYISDGWLPLDDIYAGCVYLDGVVWEPIIVNNTISYENLHGATHTNPETYQEGCVVEFTDPSEVEGYAFAGWTPSKITADMTGPQTVRANWTANNYTIEYNANGGTGTMAPTHATYDSEVIVEQNAFVRPGFTFKGWALEESGDVVYAPGQSVMNLTAKAGGVITLYAKWVNAHNFVINSDGFLLEVILGNDTVVVIPDGVTSIYEDAFYDCSLITSVTIPDSVVSVDSSTFYNCKSLQSINVSSDNDIYKSVDGLLLSKDGKVLIACPRGRKRVVIPDSVTSIGDNAFYACDSLTSVTIPDSVTSIGYWAFAFSSLTSVTMPDSVTSIGDWAFYVCDSLTSVTIPDSVTSIGDWAFANSSLTSVTIPDSVTSIGEGAFAFSSLTSVTIPDSVTNIGDFVFFWCESLTSVVVPKNIASNGHCLFARCEQLPNEEGFFIIDDVLYYCNLHGDITIPDSVTTIGSGAFCYGYEDNDCYDDSITSITIPNSVTNIESLAFVNCRALTSVAIPISVANIDDKAFYNCPNLKRVELPETLRSQVEEGFIFRVCPSDLEIIYTPIPEVIDDSKVAAALKGSADAKLAANIKTVAEYAAYRAWALGLEGVTAQEVKESPNAWLSYALDTDALIAAAPKEGDVVIDTFEIAATEGAFEFTVKIDGITVGENALGANLKKVFGIEGAETLASGGAGFSTDNVEVNTAAPESGNVKFTVTPKKGNGEKPDSFFFRVKMK